MKRYIKPNTEVVAVNTAQLCDSLVNSVQGGTLQYGGNVDSIDPN